MHYEKTIEISAAPAAVWAVLVDVEQWPSWTASIRKAELLTPPPFAVGAQVKVSQPKLPTATWTVTDCEPERNFTWENKSPGMTSVAHHRVEANGDGSRVTLVIDQSGPVGAVVGALYSRLTKRYVDTEAAGLKARCEQTS